MLTVRLALDQQLALIRRGGSEGRFPIAQAHTRRISDLMYIVHACSCITLELATAVVYVLFVSVTFMSTLLGLQGKL